MKRNNLKEGNWMDRDEIEEPLYLRLKENDMTGNNDPN